MASTMPARWSSAIALLVIVALDVHAAQNYTAIPRWGQASAIIYGTLFISGGKTDPSHQYTYSSAPNTNDLLSLDLTSSFSLSSPPWSYASGSQNTSTSQGPAVAFHTLTPYTSSDLLLFGGDSGFAAIQTNADSAWLLNAEDRLDPSWVAQATGWASEPIRRVYHAAPSASGAIYILGGQKDDGSQIGFPDSYLFNAVGNSGSPVFIALSNTENAPPGLFGHAAHVLPDGILLVFGGFASGPSPSPSPLNVIYTLNTTSPSPTWSIQNASGGTTPTPRRGFASVLLDDGKVLIHGGADATLQQLYNDGALLDTTQNPMTWSPVSALADVLGYRVGHFAAPIQGQVLFGFGWAGSAPASSDLALYDPTSSAFEPSYTPPPAPVSITTLPVSPTTPGGTYPTSGAGTTQGGAGTNGPGGPSHTGSGSSPTSGSGHGQGGGSGGGGNTNGDGGDNGQPKSGVAGIIAGSVLGFLAFVALAGGGAYYALRRRERRAWMGIDANVRKDVEGRWRLISEDEPWDAADESPTHPGEKLQMAGTGWQGQPRRGWGLLGLGALVGGGAAADANRARKRRFDMLADEDARQFDVDHAFNDEESAAWGYAHPKGRPVVRRGGSGGSSMSFGGLGMGTGKSAWSGVVNASVTSLRNVGAALGVTAVGAAAAREGKGRDVNPPEWWEKDVLPLDPFSDTAAAMERGAANPGMWLKNSAMRPRGGESSFSSQGSNPYVDPFSDPGEGERDTGGLLGNVHDEGTTSLLGTARGTSTLGEAHDAGTLGVHDEGTTSTLGGAQTDSSQGSIPRSGAMLGLARAGADSPGISERGGGTSVDSHDAPSSRTTQSNTNSTSNSTPGIGGTSHTSSNDHSSGLSSPTSPRTTSIIGAAGAPSAPIRRSDTWWSRFSRTSFRDRHAFQDATRHPGENGLVEFRDPNPAPRLGPIRESSNSSPQTAQDGSPASGSGSGTGGGTSRAKARKEGSGYAASTKSSIKTDFTADSEAIERMGGRMEVVQRALSLTSRGTASPSTATGSPEMPDDANRWGLSPVEASGSDDSHPRSWMTGNSTEEESFIAESPQDAHFRISGDTFGRATRRGAGPSTEPANDPSSSARPISGTSSMDSPALAGPRAPRRALTGAIAARVSAYEQRMSQDPLMHNGPRSPPADTKARQKDKDEERKRRSSVGYGLVPKAPLFVANPDRRKPSSSGSA